MLEEQPTNIASSLPTRSSKARLKEEYLGKAIEGPHLSFQADLMRMMPHNLRSVAMLVGHFLNDSRQLLVGGFQVRQCMPYILQRKNVTQFLPSPRVQQARAC